MKKLLAILVFIFLVTFVSFADIKLTLDSSASFIRSGQLAPSVGFSVGLNNDTIHYGVYGLAMLALYPGGSRTGINVAGEFSLEGGGRAVLDVIDYDSFTFFAGVSIGYYAQLISLPNSKNDYFRLNNGVMIRPQFGIRVLKDAFANVELGLGYQKALWPNYKDYDGFFVLLRFMKY